MSDDSNLQQAVLSELSWEPSLIAGHIGVTARAGVVTLTGHVETFSDKHAAEVAAGRVRGVKAVAEEIEVRLPFDLRRDDEQVAAAAISRLAWDASLPRDAINVKVEKGWMTLSGKVDWYYQSQNAAEDVRRLLGVVGVTNHITVNPRVDVQNVSDNIMHALHRSWLFDPNSITVSAEGGKVRLGGVAKSWHDRQVAAATAWSAPGVVAVENDISVI